MRPIQLTNRNTMFTQPMGDECDLNLGLIRGDVHNFVIDTGLGSNSVALILEAIRGDDKPIIVVNTHWHWDHVWGNWKFADCTIIAHPICRKLQEQHWEESVTKFSAAHGDGEIRKCLPNMLVEESVCFPEDRVKIFFAPGHSADGVSVYDQIDKVLYAGDNIGDNEEKVIPYIDTDPQTLRATIAKYKALDFSVCISGHNKPQPKTVLQRMEDALDECWNAQLAQFGEPERMR